MKTMHHAIRITRGKCNRFIIFIFLLTYGTCVVSNTFVIFTMNKIRIKLAKLYEKKSNIKLDFNHKLSHYLVKNHDLIVMENLKVKNMTKSAKGTIEKPGTNVSQKSGLNRSILENNWGPLRQVVEYKCVVYGKHFKAVNHQYTSQKCSNCSHIDKDNRKDKIFLCLKCGQTQDADLNASINIKTAGLAGFACGELSLDGSVKQELETILKT
jgi:putative transposase